MRQGDSEQAQQAPQAQTTGRATEGERRVAPGKTTLTGRMASRGRAAQRAAAGASDEGAPGLDLGVAAGQGGDEGDGTPRRLPAETRARMEWSFGARLDDVSVHPGSERAGGNVQALAEGRDVHFAPGRYQPGTQGGDWLIAHELAHVVQQSGGSAGAQAFDAGGAVGALEAEADRAASHAVAGQRFAIQGCARAGTAQAFTGGGGGGRQGGGPEGDGGGAAGGDGPGPRTVTVREGDTLWGLAERHLGSGERWPEIYALNRGVVGNDPNLILPEQALTVPPSDEELQQHLEQVQAEAEEQGVCEEGEEEAAQQEGEEGQEVAGEEVAGEGGEGAGLGGEGGEGGGVQTGPNADGSLPFWEQVKQAFAWDEEIAQHDTFRSAAAECAGGGGGGAGAGEAVAAVPDTGTLVFNALLQGAGAGLVMGGVSLAIDTAINMGSSRIPMLAGFVELGQMVYGLATDPAGWASGKLNGLLGNNADGTNKYAEGLRKIASGDPLDAIEGVVDLFDGLKSTIDTLSSICWIVAGLGFILSWIPGMQWLIPFVALAAKWGTVLGGVATVMGAVLSILRGILIFLRTIDLLVGESDPEVARQKAERLQADTQAFVQAWTERAGNKARDSIAGPPQRRQTGEAPQRSNTASGERPSPLRRALGFAASTAFGTEKFSMREGDLVTGERRGDLRQLGVDLAAASRGTVAIARPGQTTGQRIHALESQGVDVYLNQWHRDHVNRRLGEQSADPSSDQGALGQSRRRVADAEERARQARADREQADADMRRAQQDLETANQRLQDARDQNAPARQHHEREVAEARALADSYAADVRAVDGQMSTAQTTLDMARSAHAAHPDGVGADGVPFRVKVAQAEADMARLQRDMDLARSGHQEALAMHREERQALDRLIRAEQSAQADVDRTTTTRDAAGNRQADATRSEADAGSADAGARADLRAVEGDTRHARDNFDRRMQRLSEYVWWRDVTGKGADGGNLYGHNRGSGVTGFLTGHVMGDPGTEGTISHHIQDTVQSHLQVGEPGAGGQAGGAQAEPGPDYQALICDQVTAAAAALPAPPLDVPDRVDGAAAAMAELLAEEELIEAQREQAAELRGVGEQSLLEIDGARELVLGGHGAAECVQAETDVLLDRQAEMQSQGESATAEAGNAAGQAGEGQGLIAGFAGKFLELMGRIPGRFVGNAGEGAGGAQRLQEAGTAGPEAAANAQDTATAASAQAGAWQGETQAIQGQVEGTSGELDTLGSNVDEHGVETEQGLAELDQADADIEAALAEIAAEKARLIAEHGDAVAAGQSWTEEHRGIRLAELAAIDALVGEAEAASGGPGGGAPGPG